MNISKRFAKRQSNTLLKANLKCIEMVIKSEETPLKHMRFYIKLRRIYMEEFADRELKANKIG